MFLSQGRPQAEVGSSNPVQADDSQDYLITRQSCNLHKDTRMEIVIVKDNEDDILGKFLDEFADDVVEEQTIEHEVANAEENIDDL